MPLSAGVCLHSIVYSQQALIVINKCILLSQVYIKTIGQESRKVSKNMQAKPNWMHFTHHLFPPPVMFIYNPGISAVSI